ncbi:MAG: sugar phosphate isomerase/epimerase [Lentisphaeraceae bacterium]|nr:sugar phosphate isomerase/epimerase [Lentisphaeraceae bacterium]
MKQSKISIGSWAFSFGPFEDNPWSFEDVCQYAADNKYDGIEINGFKPHPHPDDYNTDEKCAKLKRFITDLGLGISAFAADFRTVPPAKVEKSKFLNEVKKCLDFCKRMEIDILRVDTISPPDDLSPEVYKADFKRLTDNWRAAAELAQQYSVTIVWEFEPGFWLNKPSEIIAAVKTVNHDNFKVLFDTSHAYMCAVVGARQVGEKETLAGGINELCRQLNGYIGHFHLIDSDGTLHDEETSTHSPFGTGNVDFKAFFEEFKSELSNSDYWCCDFCFCPTTEKDGKDAVPFLTNLVNDVNKETVNS